MTLTEFLLARIAEDERLVAERSVENIPSDCWGPDRVEAECEAKRAIVELHGPHGQFDDVPCRELAVVAAVYSDHPDYDESWRP